MNKGYLSHHTLRVVEWKTCLVAIRVLNKPSVLPSLGRFWSDLDRACFYVFKLDERRNKRLVNAFGLHCMAVRVPHSYDSVDGCILCSDVYKSNIPLPFISHKKPGTFSLDEKGPLSLCFSSSIEHHELLQRRHYAQLHLARYTVLMNEEGDDDDEYYREKHRERGSFFPTSLNMLAALFPQVFEACTS
eukprot:c12557_g1_i1 orf=1-564(-)